MQWQRLAPKAGGTQGSVMSSEESTFLDAPFDSVDSMEHKPANGAATNGDPNILRSGMCFWVMSGEVQLSVMKRGHSKRDKAMSTLGRMRNPVSSRHNTSQELWDDELVQPSTYLPQAMTKCVGTVLHGQPLCGFSSGLSGALEGCTATASSGAEVLCVEAAVLLTLPNPWSEKVLTAWRRVEAHRARQIGTARHDREGGEEDSQMSSHKPSKKDKGPWTIMKSQWLKRKIFGSETSQRVSWLSKAHKQVSPKYQPVGWDKGAKKQGDDSRNVSHSFAKSSQSLWSSDGGHSSQNYASRLLDICLGEDEQAEEPNDRQAQPGRHRSQKARRRLLTAQDVRPGSGPFFERPISSAGQSIHPPFLTVVPEVSEKDSKARSSSNRKQSLSRRDDDRQFTAQAP